MRLCKTHLPKPLVPIDASGGLMALDSLLPVDAEWPRTCSDEDHHRVREHVRQHHEVAEAISEGAREAQPDADVGCVAVAAASPELIKSTDLLVVGGPTHIRGMTSGFSRKMGVSGEEKAEAKGEPTHEMEEDAEGPGVREWFDVYRRLRTEARPRPSIPAFRRQWRVVQPAGLPAGCVSTAITW
jgi:hypothetical protein